MSDNTLQEKLQSNPPRLVILFRIGDNGGEEYQWGIVGTVPVLTLVGSIVGAQAKIMGGSGATLRSSMYYGHESARECEESAFVIVFEEDGVSYWGLPTIPKTSLVGMLEIVKASIVSGRLGQQAAAQRTQILGPDGTPAANGIRR